STSAPASPNAQVTGGQPNVQPEPSRSLASAPPMQQPPAQYDVPAHYMDDVTDDRPPEHYESSYPPDVREMSTPAESPAPTPATGLRHQLRSQRKGLQQSGGAKKPNATSTSKESVLD